MKILVTGSSGFIGRWTCSTLRAKGNVVVGLDKKPKNSDQEWLPFYHVDIVNERRLESVVAEVEPDVIIHLAARTDLGPKKDIQAYSSNIDGVKNLLNCVAKITTIKRVIVTSSQLVCRVGYVPRSDTDYCPDTLYGQSKVLTEKITREMDGGGVVWCLTRPTTVWGPHVNEHYQQFLRMVEKGRYFHCGTGRLWKSYGYVGNIAHQYWRLTVAPPELINRKTFYLADYSPFSVRDYADMIARGLGARRIPTVPICLARILAAIGDVINKCGWRGFPFNTFRLRNILTEYQFDLSETRRVCGELPYSFEQGVHETIRWYKTLASG